MTRWGMAIDLRRCIGCQTCVSSCKVNNHTPRGVSLCRVHDYEAGRYPNVSRRFLPLACMHCGEAPCVEACPTGASRRRGDGIIAVDQEKCIGCRYCMMVCPYSARSFHPKESLYFAAGPSPYERSGRERVQSGTVAKCDLCADRIDEGLKRGLRPGVDPEATPICAVACITNARTFGDLEDPEGPVSKIIRGRRSSRLLPELGTDPAVYYLE